MRILGVFTTAKHSLCLKNLFKYFCHADHFIKKKKILFFQTTMFSWCVCSACKLQYQMGHSSRVNQSVCAEDGTSRCPELPPGNASVPAPSSPGSRNQKSVSGTGLKADRVAGCTQPSLAEPYWGWDPQGMKPHLWLVKQSVKAHLCSSPHLYLGHLKRCWHCQTSACKGSLYLAGLLDWIKC